MSCISFTIPPLWPSLNHSPSSLNCTFPPHAHNTNDLMVVKNVQTPFIGTFQCKAARRRVRYDEVDDDKDFGYNEDIAMLEMYSQLAKQEALIVTAMVDDQQVEVLIFKGFSSCLNYETSPDPSKSVIPQRAKIKFIDRIRGPFNPANIHYIEKGLSLETFKTRLSMKSNVVNKNTNN